MHPHYLPAGRRANEDDTRMEGAFFAVTPGVTRGLLFIRKNSRTGYRRLMDGRSKRADNAIYGQIPSHVRHDD